MYVNKDNAVQLRELINEGVQTTAIESKVMREVKVNGITMYVEDKDDSKLAGVLREDAVIDDLSNWKAPVNIYTKCLFNSQFQDECVLYDSDRLIEKAKEFSELVPPDVVLFSEASWSAFALFLKEFYLENCKLLMTSHSANRALANAIRKGLDEENSEAFKKIFSGAEK
jgi:hypothetical protein